MRVATVYISEDGNQFETEATCIEHESKILPYRTLASCSLTSDWGKNRIENLLTYMKERPSIFIPYLLPELKEELLGYKDYIESTGDTAHGDLETLLKKLKY